MIDCLNGWHNSLMKDLSDLIKDLIDLIKDLSD